MEKTKCLIIGSGPAGYTAAIYASRANLSPVLFEGMQPGGQLTITTEVENFPGYPESVTGSQLMEDLRKQAEKFGTDIRSSIIESIDFSKRPYKAICDDKSEIEADTVIIATGASAKYLGLDDEKKYAGLGVSACATCDGFFYRNRTVAVIGGGDTACEEAIYLSNLAKEVYLVVRKGHLRASKIMQDRIFKKNNIKILFNTVVEGIYGEEFVEGLHVVAEDESSGIEWYYKLPVDGMFLAIGHKPNTDFLNGQIELDENGYIKTNGTSTSIPGVFAAGDVADPRYKQAISAAGTGCRAAIDAERYLNEN